MYDDDLFNFDLLNSYTTTETEEDSATETQQQSFNPYTESKPYIDDYSTSQKYETERTYESRQANQFDEVKTNVVRQMDKPTIVQQAPAVKLTKSKEKMYLSARLKVAATVFFAIFAAILFATVWNFAQAGIMRANFDAKQAEIGQLENSIADYVESIKDLEASYKLLLTDPNSYVDKVENVNSFTLSMEDFKIEPEVEFVETNWFNDVCEFFRSIFA